MHTHPLRRLARTAHMLAVIGTFSATSVALVAASPLAHANALTSKTFGSTGTVQWFTVPAGVQKLFVVAAGGNGNYGQNANATNIIGSTVTSFGGSGGLGGTVSAFVPVTSGERLSVNVGSRGTSASVGYGNAPGGSAGQTSYNVSLRSGQGNGGGSTFVSRADGTPLVVAGGGAGGGDAGYGDSNHASDGGAGGAGGGYAGTTGHSTFGGTGGAGSSSQQAGGHGGDATIGSLSGGGGGGGGGWSPNGNGGGGGGGAGFYVPLTAAAGGGGAGGLNYSVDPQAVQGIANAAGDGSVTIAWSQPEPTTGTLTASSEPGIVGQPVTFTFRLFNAAGSPLVPGDSTITIGTYDPATRTEVTQATWIAPWNVAPYWTVSLPVGTATVWAAFSGNSTFAPFKTNYITHTTNLATRSISVNPTSVSFGNHPIGSTTNRTVTITNTGTLPWILGRVAMSEGAFRITGGTCGPKAVAPNTSCTFVIAFVPKAHTSLSATLTVTDAVGTSTAIALSGTIRTGNASA
jgi:Abnormal spindle-like microcephaly-assoc'd, ASPM-SPD-2-Hydin